MLDDLDAIIEAVTVDAFNEGEQLWAFHQAFEEEIVFPSPATVVGTPVEILGVDLDGRGLVATCRRDGRRYTVSLTDVDLPPASEARRLMAAYRRWLGVPEPPRPAWVYPRFGDGRTLTHPLRLEPAFTWDPDQEYWGEPDDVPDPLAETIVAAGPRPAFEMEQVLPGEDPDDPDDDPILRAVDLRAAGDVRAAVRLLEGLLAEDERCLDAYAHLGNLVLDARGPKAALVHYAAGVSVAEASLPDGFGSVLPRTLIDNRPFLRCLHGFGLCMWRSRRFDDAARVFGSMVWLDPADGTGARFCLDDVQARRAWRA